MSVIAQRHRHIRVDHPSTRLLTPEEARLFGQWLIEAADVAEGKPEAVDA